jgi:Glycosyltransferase family 87
MNSSKCSQPADREAVATPASLRRRRRGALGCIGGAEAREGLLSGCQAAAQKVLPLTVWGVLPVALTVWATLGVARVHAGDFHYAFWPAGQHVLHGVSPYVDPGSPVIAHAIAFVYPALAALLLAPFALIARGPADTIFAWLNIAAVLLTLRVLDVRDWRLYGLVLLCPAVFSGWTLANVTLMLGLGIAAIWRCRERPLPTGFLTAVLVSLKLFLWPLALWLLATRRYGAFAYAVVCGLAINGIAWTLLGWHELHRYSRLLHALAATEERRGYSVVSLALREGISHSAAYAIAAATAACGAAACLALARRERQVAAMALALGTSLLATPIVQLHYFALLIVPLALVRPRLSRVWVLPLAMWVCASPVHAWQLAAALSIAATMALVAVRLDPIPRTSAASRSGKPRRAPQPSPRRATLSRLASRARGGFGQVPANELELELSRPGSSPRYRLDPGR